MHQPPLAYSINEAAEAAGLGRDSIYGAISEGRLRARKYGKRTLVLHTDLQAFLEALPRLGAA